MTALSKPSTEFLQDAGGEELTNVLTRSLSQQVPTVSSSADLTDPSGDHVLNPDFAQVTPGAKLKPAAVLIAIDRSLPEPDVVLTVRTSNLSAHASQIAFPGGKVDPGETPPQTALREACEEVAMPPSLVQIEGFLPSYASRTGYRVYPVVGTVDGLPDLRPNPGEVASIFKVPLRFLLTYSNAQKTSRVFEGKERFFYTYQYKNYRIWGLTAGIIHHMSSLIQGQADPVSQIQS